MRMSVEACVSRTTPRRGTRVNSATVLLRVQLSMRVSFEVCRSRRVVQSAWFGVCPNRAALRRCARRNRRVLLPAENRRDPGLERQPRVLLSPPGVLAILRAGFASTSGDKPHGRSDQWSSYGSTSLALRYGAHAHQWVATEGIAMSISMRRSARDNIATHIQGSRVPDTYICDILAPVRLVIP